MLVGWNMERHRLAYPVIDNLEQIALEQTPLESATPQDPATAQPEAKRVLLVDDNIDSAELMAEVLRCEGLDVAIATHPSAALAMVTTFSPQVALLDIGLPEMDGYELARQIARTQVDCRLIAITGYGGTRARARSREAGFSVHLVKPVTLEVLLAVISGGTAPESRI